MPRSKNAVLARRVVEVPTRQLQLASLVLAGVAVSAGSVVGVVVVLVLPPVPTTTLESLEQSS